MKVEGKGMSAKKDLIKASERRDGIDRARSVRASGDQKWKKNYNK